MEKGLLKEETKKKVRKREDNRRNLDIDDGNKMVGWYGGLVELIDRHGIMKLLQAFGIIVLTISFLLFANAFSNEEIIEKWIIEREVMHDEGTKIRTEVSPEVNKTLIKILYELEADRVSVIEMHNGKENPTSLPFVFCDMTYEQTRERVNYVSEDFVDLNMSKFNFPSYVYEHRYFIGSLEEMFEIDKRMALRMEVNETKYLGVIFIRGTEDIGFLMVSYLEKPTIEDEKILTSLIYHAQEVGTLLDYKVQIDRREMK